MAHVLRLRAASGPRPSGRRVRTKTKESPMRYVPTPVLAAALIALAFAAAPAKAHVFAAKITAPSAVENVACRIVRERIQRFPFAPAEFREREVCEPDRVVSVGE